MCFTLEEKGAYLELLILQFNQGKFTEAQAKHMLSTCSSGVWANIKHKFIKDGDYYYQSRLQEEIEKRRAFSLSRKNNALGSKDKKAYAKHMENENETETETINKNKEDFEKTRNLYPNTKRGLDTEFDYFRKTHKDWKEVLPTLETALKNQIEQRKKMTGFVPEWKHFKSWIYNRSWEEQKESKETQTYKIPSLN